ncbi:hypothetical protein C8R46DRAFT_1205819 [Mycena filopes]|nr:hypothetical protein C8R46DRAFT_1205819 [Mycena filopes]
MSPPAKRQRTDSTASITRSNIWYRDGSVVLQAQNMQFRVHFSVLALNSPFFHNLQDLPQPTDEPTIEGCPVIVLQDSCVDIGHLLLGVLYSPTFLLEQTIPLPVVAALLRCGRKYDFKDLLHLAVERLTSDFNSIFQFELEPDSPKPPKRIISYPGQAFDVITLARENNILSVLPCAYYLAVKAPQAAYFDGIPRGDGTVASLATIDQRRCVLGREALVAKQFQQGYTLGWLAKWDFDSAECTANCSLKRAALLAYYLNAAKMRTFSAYKSSHNLCEQCEQRAKEATLAGRKKAWEELPGFFGLPPWGELENEM